MLALNKATVYVIEPEHSGQDLMHLLSSQCDHDN